jgi:hypothetical protein
MINFFNHHMILSIKSRPRQQVRYYPKREIFEKNPTKVRTPEVSQLQDQIQERETRGPERKAYEKKVESRLRDKRK